MHSKVPTFFKNGIKSYTHASEESGQKAKEDGEKEEQPTMGIEKGLSTAGAVGSGHREAVMGRPHFRRPASHRQASSRAVILGGHKRVCKNPNHGDFLVFLVLI